MKRPWWSRALALFVGVWFVAASAGPELTHACPMHGTHAVAASFGAGHAGHDTGSPSIRVAHHSGSNTESAPERGTQCTCLGHCCCTAPVAFIATTVALADVVTAATRDTGLLRHEYVPVFARHVLPLAHAPPLSA